MIINLEWYYVILTLNCNFILSHLRLFPQPHFSKIAYFSKIGYISKIVLLIRLFSRYSLLSKNKLFSRVRILYHMIYHVYKYRSCVYHTHDVSVFFLVTCSDFQRKARLSRNFYIFKHQGGFNSENNNIFHIMYLLQNYYDQHYSIATLIY